MIRRTHRLRISPLMGLLLGVCALVGLTSAVAYVPAHSKTLSASWTAAPVVPRPLFFDADRDASPAQHSSDSHVPAAHSLAAQASPQLQDSPEREDQHRWPAPEFSPLYRRPPPSVS